MKPLYRNPQLHRLWAVGMLMSLIRWLEILAFAVFTYEHTGSALWVASLMMLRLLPLSLFGLVLGALASHLSRRRLLITTHVALFNLFGWPVLSMIPVIGHDQLLLDVQGVGLLASLDGIGSLLAALMLASIAGRLRQGPVYLGLVLLFLLLQIAFASSGQVVLSGLALLVMGVAQAGFAVMQPTLVYNAGAPDRRTDTLGLMTMCIGVSALGFLALSCAVSGLVATALTWPLCRECFHEPIKA